MAIVTYPLNNVEYTAEDAELFHVTRTSGIYARSSFQYSVSGANNIIIIGTGIGWIKNSEFAGKVIAQKESVSIDMGIADSVYPRIDAIVIQFSANSNETNIVVKKGTASTNAVAPPVVRDESVYELHLYHVLRKAGELTISPSNITDLRLDENYCGLMADSVTSVDTNAINLQISALIENLRKEIESVEDKSAFWLKNDTIPVNNGGTGASSPEQARNNLGITAENIGALSKNGGTMSGAIAMGGNKVTGLAAPTENADAVNKEYADKMLQKSGGTMTGYLNFDGSNGFSWTTADGTIIHLRPYAPNNVFQITMQNPSKGIGEYGALNMFTDGGWQFRYPEKVRNAIGAAAATTAGVGLLAYPVGSIYISYVSTSPAALFGGTWAQLTDRFLLAAGNTYSLGAIGGAATHTLTTNEMPSHQHAIGINVGATGFGTHYNLPGTTNDTGTPSYEWQYYTSGSGGGDAHNNMPPYMAVNMWIRQE